MNLRILGLVLLLAACSGIDALDDTGSSLDATTEVVQDLAVHEVIIKYDTLDSSNDDFNTSEIIPVDDAHKDLPPLQCAPGEGCFLDKCDENAACQSGWCVQHLGEGVCSQICQDECAPGWSCKQVAGTDPDLVYVCVSDFANLCRPCTTNADCTSTGGAEDACIDYGQFEGNFCGGPCLDEEDCPWGFSCKNVLTVQGSSIQQCVNTTGECPCTDSSIAMGLATACVLDNDFGTCDGKRTCTGEGLSACDAPEPQPDTCNGIDDDCDGETDEPTLLDGNYVNLCDDTNDCTDDKCIGIEGCVNEVLHSGTCDDANPCTIADHCVEGTCVGDPVECDDDNPCTDNICTDTGGCEYPPNELSCDDGNPCTLADQCQEGTCVGTDVPCQCQQNEDCTVNEDGDLCNGSLICDTSTLPYQCTVAPDTIISCPEPAGINAFCLQETCNPDTGECSFTAHNQGFLCDNNDACTVNNVCTEGICQGGLAVNCNDGNLCTDDSCNSESGCLHTANTAACSDGNVCTSQDVCSAGDCTAGSALECGDNNMCNGQETCNPETGCVPGAPLVCIDDNPCNGQETCDPATGCMAGVLLICDDGNPCTDDSCDPLKGCLQVPNDVSCNTGNACTTEDTCSGGTCVPGKAVICNDNNICTDDSCAPAVGCVYTVNAAWCDDGDVCTIGDKCASGQCGAGAGSLTCDDGNICTDDSCEAETGCLHLPNAVSCDDDNVCTQDDFCASGWCTGNLVVCTDANPCTNDSCQPGNGCVFTHNQIPCTDDDPCTVGDTCGQGLCQEGSGKLECDDSNVCTDDLCEKGNGCTYMFNDLPCDDIDGCTVEDFCQQGLCLGIQLDQQDFVQTWDWESGALDDWTVEQGGPISIVAGHESPFGLRVEGGGNTRLKATGTIVEPFDMTGQKGSFLPLAEGAFMHVDMTISVPTGHGVYLDIYIHGKETKSRWICYPFDGYGSSEDLGDGWYRNHFHNHHVYGYEENWGEVPPEVPYMTVTFNSFAPAGCTIDGFIIQPNLELAGFPQECQQ